MNKFIINFYYIFNKNNNNNKFFINSIFLK